jgi:ABC-type histidine transport system ATPase subunit
VLKKTDLNLLRAEVGFVFQQFNLYPHLSVLNNITPAPTKIRKTPKKEAEEQAMQLLERVGLTVKRDADPSQLIRCRAIHLAQGQPDLAPSPEKITGQSSPHHPDKCRGTI